MSDALGQAVALSLSRVDVTAQPQTLHRCTAAVTPCTVQPSLQADEVRSGQANERATFSMLLAFSN